MMVIRAPMSALIVAREQVCVCCAVGDPYVAGKRFLLSQVCLCSVPEAYSKWSSTETSWKMSSGNCTQLL